MVWKSKFIDDTDNKDIGTCVAEWVDGDVVLLRYEARVETNDPTALRKFAKDAQKLLDDKTIREAEIKAKEAAINALLAEKQ